MRIHIVLLLSIVGLLAGPAPGRASSFGYDPSAGGGQFPTAQGFDLVEIGASPGPFVIELDPSVGSLVLHQGETEFGGYQYWTRTGFSADVLTDTVEITLDMKILSSDYLESANRRAGWGMVFAGSTGDFVALGVAEDRLFLNTTDAGVTSGVDSDLFFVDTTDAYHNYRLRIEGGVGTLYFDGASVLSVDVCACPHSSFGPNIAAFGDWSQLAQSESLILGLSTVPEPGIGGLLLAGAGAGLAVRRRIVALT